MKTKLQALIAEQKALTARFEELLHSDTEDTSTLDPQKVYIRGHLTRGAEVIKMLEDLGGVNILGLSGKSNLLHYFIANGNIVPLTNPDHLIGYTEVHLPEKVDQPKDEPRPNQGDFYVFLENIKREANRVADYFNELKKNDTQTNLCSDRDH